MPKFNVKNEWDTVQYIIDNRVGIARYGDGEEKLAQGRKIKSQLADRNLAHRLREIPRSNNPKCIVGIPNIYEGILGIPGTKPYTFWETMLRKGHGDGLYDPKKQYYSSFISRMDNAASINNIEYVNHIKKIWDGRKTVVLSGEKIKFCKHPYLLENANIIAEISGPNVNAWSNYQELLDSCLTFPDDVLILMRLGPTATVLAWDLGLKGRQAIDCGHLGMFVNRFMTNDPNAHEPEFLNYGKPMGT